MIEDAGGISTGGQDTWDQSGGGNKRDKFILYRKGNGEGGQDHGYKYSQGTSYK